MNLSGPPTILARLQRWSGHRRPMSNVRLMTMALACVALTYSATFLGRAPSQSLPEAAPEPDRTPAFGVVGVGLSGICAEIDDRDTDPRKRTDCEPRRLAAENIDLDYPRARPRSADILVGNSVLRAGEKAYFMVLEIDERPSYAKCASGHAGRQYWLSFTDLPGLTVCIRSDEGRTAILQAESVDARGTAIDARLTVWNKP